MTGTTKPSAVTVLIPFFSETGLFSNNIIITKYLINPFLRVKHLLFLRRKVWDIPRSGIRLRVSWVLLVPVSMDSFCHLLLGGWNKGKRQDYLLHALGGGIGQHPDIPGDKILLPEVTLIIKKCRDPFFCCWYNKQVTSGHRGHTFSWCINLSLMSLLLTREV